MLFRYYWVASAEQLVEEDEGDGEGGEPTDEEKESMEEEGRVAEGVVVGELLDHQRLRQTPADKKAEDDAAEGHDPLGGEVVEGIEEVATIERLEVCEKSKGQTAQGAQNHRCERHIGGGAPTGRMVAVYEKSRHLLVHGDGAGQRRQYQQHIKHQREEVANEGQSTEEGVEDLRQGDKYESWSCIGRHTLHGEYGGKDDESAEEGDQGVDSNDIGGGLH